MLILAHAGHWFVGLAYFAPVGAFLVWLGITTMKDRRAEREEEDSPEGHR
jgi:threonine/homoserine/homoserine lactone efflux protein